METRRDQGPQGPVQASEFPLSVPQTLLYRSQPTQLLNLRTRTASNRPEVAVPFQPPLRSKSRLLRVYWRAKEQ